MPGSVYATASGASTAGTTVSAGGSKFGVKAGSTLWVYVQYRTDQINPHVTGVTDTAGNTFTARQTSGGVGGNPTNAELWACDSATGINGDTVTATLSAADLANIVVLAVTNAGSPSFTKIGAAGTYSTGTNMATATATSGGITAGTKTDTLFTLLCAFVTGSIGVGWGAGAIATSVVTNVAGTVTMGMAVYQTQANPAGTSQTTTQSITLSPAAPVNMSNLDYDLKAGPLASTTGGGLLGALLDAEEQVELPEREPPLPPGEGRSDPYTHLPSTAG